MTFSKLVILCFSAIGKKSTKFKYNDTGKKRRYSTSKNKIQL